MMEVMMEVYFYSMRIQMGYIPGGSNPEYYIDLDIQYPDQGRKIMEDRI